MKGIVKISYNLYCIVVFVVVGYFFLICYDGNYYNDYSINYNYIVILL